MVLPESDAIGPISRQLKKILPQFGANAAP